MHDPAAEGLAFSRFVALGDSTTEGLDDPYPPGHSLAGGYRGWADRLAERLADANPALTYANLAIRGRKLAQIRAEQLSAALELEPDLASAIAGVNDVLRPSVDLEARAGDLEAIVSALRERGASVLMATYPDLTRTISVGGSRIRPRLLAFNAAIREIAARRGARLIDIERDAVVHPALWSTDRLHASPLGHEWIAAAAAATLGAGELDPGWEASLPAIAPPRRHRRIAGDAVWAGRHLAPWVLRRLRGTSSGDGITPKRPRPLPVERG